MIESWSRNHRRFLAVGILAAVVLLAWGAMVDPLFRYLQASADDRETDLRALSRDQALIKTDSEVSKALAELAQSPRWTRLYASQKADKATLQMETDLRELISTPNNPTSMVAEPAIAKGPLTRIAVKVTLTMPIDQLAGTLERLQTYSKLLQIESMTVQGPDYQSPNSNPTLGIQAEIVGYMLTSTGTLT
jgi:hypothetical protein